MRHFVNQQMRGPNVMTVPVNRSIVAEFDNPEFQRSSGFESMKPNWDSDIEWVSPSTPQTHRIFESAFERMGIGDRARYYLDIDNEVRLYAGFLVIRSECRTPNFHVDWIKTGNEAFTMLTPVTANSSGFGLLYQTLNHQVAEYDYKPGEAIVFGDDFVHSTKPGHSTQPVVLLCFEFGTDKMEHWPKIFETIGRQSGMLRQPDGEFVKIGPASRSGY